MTQALMVAPGILRVIGCVACLLALGLGLLAGGEWFWLSFIVLAAVVGWQGLYSP